MPYPLSSNTWDDAELQALDEVIRSGHFTMGQRVKRFEEKFAAYFGSKFAVMVNSGSSANLLAVAALTLCSQNTLKVGDEVLVPAVSWSTTYYPLHQYGLHMRFVDIDLDTLNLDLNLLEEAITSRTKAVFAVNLLGNPNDFKRLKEFCDKHGLALLEDNCESMGARYEGRYTGTFGRCGTFSTFYSHHICTMEGGILVTDDEEVSQLAKSLRAHGWTREMPDRNLVYDKIGDPFEDCFRFVVPGYNLRPLEMSAAVGLLQLDKLHNFIEARRQNATLFRSMFDGLDYVAIQKTIGESSWFGFALILRGALAGRRDEVVRNLVKAEVECRPVVAGNFAQNPVVKRMPHSVFGRLTNADKVHKDGLYVGNYHQDLADGFLLLRNALEATLRDDRTSLSHMAGTAASA